MIYSLFWIIIKHTIFNLLTTNTIASISDVSTTNVPKFQESQKSIQKKLIGATWWIGGLVAKKFPFTIISAAKALRYQESPKYLQNEEIGAIWCLGGLVAKKFPFTIISATKALKLQESPRAFQ